MIVESLQVSVIYKVTEIKMRLRENLRHPGDVVRETDGGDGWGERESFPLGDDELAGGGLQGFRACDKSGSQLGRESALDFEGSYFA